MIQMTEQEFQTISLYVRRNYGINLDKKKYLIESKLWIELARAHALSYSDYWQKLRADASGTMEKSMMALLTTNYSFFLREKKHFEYMLDTVVPEMSQVPGRVFRILCAGCAAGQEAYTAAMYLLDAKRMGKLRIPFEIVGLDVSDKAVARAQKGTYGTEDYARLPIEWRNYYCEPFAHGEFSLRNVVKEHVSFYQHNLMEPLTGVREVFQLVLCRNVLIYIQEPERSQMLTNMVNVLQPLGYLFVGHTESLMQEVPGLTYVQPAIYRKGDVWHCRR